MSIVSAQAFLEKIKSDDGLRVRLQGTVSRAQRREIARAAGFDFNQEEWNVVTAGLSSEQTLLIARRSYTQPELLAVAIGCSICDASNQCNDAGNSCEEG